MTGLENKWSKQPKTGIADKINDTIKPKGPLKPRVQDGIKKLQSQIKKLDSMLTSLQQRDAKLFQRIVTATQNHDVQTSKVLGNELAEVRKVTKILSSARIALEQIELRLSTCNDLGDTVVAIMPTVGLMNGLKGSMSKFMPGADEELGRMNEMLSGLMADSFAGNNSTFSIDATTNSESEKILQEASAVAEQQTSERLPSMPEQPVSTPQSSSSNSVSDFFNNF